MSYTHQDINPYVQHQDWDGARHVALALTQQNPNDATAWYFLAQADNKLGNIGEATTSLARADQLDPIHSYVGNPAAYNELRAKLATVNQAVLVKQADDYSVSHPGEGSHPYVWGFVVLVFALVLAYVVKRLIDNGAAKRAAEEALEEARRVKAHADAKLDSYGTHSVRATGFVRPTRPPSVTPAYHTPSPAYGSQPAAASGGTTIINNGGSNSDGLLTGLLVGEALSSHNNGYVEHDVEVIHERDEPSYSSSSNWDSGSSRSSSSDFDTGSSYSSPSPSPSWDSGSSSSSSYDSGSSSWDSGSSSSFDSGSSSSFDSGSSW
jgi:hypothetical protein